jgi:hypothetical protein
MLLSYVSLICLGGKQLLIPIQEGCLREEAITGCSLTREISGFSLYFHLALELVAMTEYFSPPAFSFLFFLFFPFFFFFFFG